MFLPKRLALVALLSAGVLAGCGSSKKAADTTIAAAPETTTAAAPETTAAAGADGGLTAPAAAEGTPVAVTAGETSDTAMFLKMDPATVKAGKVTFTLVNSAAKNQHEMIILKTDEASDKLAIGADNKVSEAASVGEIPETDAGKTVTKTFDLKPGNYVFVCNIEKHYGFGDRKSTRLNSSHG